MAAKGWKQWAAGGWMLFLSACAHHAPKILTPTESAAKAYLKVEKAIKDEQYLKAASALETMQAQYTGLHIMKKVRLDLIYVYFKEGDMASVQAAAEHFIHLYPRDKKAAYAYYMLGLSKVRLYRGLLAKLAHYDISKRDPAPLRSAYQTFATLVQEFPHSAYTPDAKQHMLYLHNILALHEVRVAEFYMQRGAYLAVVNRANVVLTQYQQSPAVIPALKLAKKAYQTLGLTAQAEKMDAILKANPTHRGPKAHDAWKELKTWMNGMHGFRFHMGRERDPFDKKYRMQLS